MSEEVSWLSDSFLQPVSFARRADLVLASFVFGLTLAQLLFDLFAHQVYGRIQITFDILGEKIGSRHRDPHGTGKLAFQRLGLVMFQNHPDARGKRVEMLQLFNPARQMIVNGFGQRDVVSRKNHIHANSMLCVLKKSTGKFKGEVMGQ